MAKAPPIVMTSLVFHTHYGADGQPVAHPPGETYELHDGQGMTADQLAASFIAMGVATRADADRPAVPAPTQAVAPMTTADLPPAKRKK